VDPGLVIALAVAATNIGHDGRGLEDCTIADGNTYCTCNQSINQQASKQSSNQLKEERRMENWKNKTPGMHLIENSDAVQGSLDPLLHRRCFPPSRATTQHSTPR
jgi:hypothetical protein